MIGRALGAVFALLLMCGVTSAQEATVTGGVSGSCPVGFTYTVSGCTLTQTASNSATLDFTGLTGTTPYRLECVGLVPATNGVNAVLRIGQGATPTWKSGASDYGWAFYYNAPTVGGGFSAAAADTNMKVAGVITNTASNGGASFNADFDNLSASQKKGIYYASRFTNGTDYFNIAGAGFYVTDANPWTAVRVLMDSGNITSGSCRLIAKP